MRHHSTVLPVANLKPFMLRGINFIYTYVYIYIHTYIYTHYYIDYNIYIYINNMYPHAIHIYIYTPFYIIYNTYIYIHHFISFIIHIYIYTILCSHIYIYTIHSQYIYIYNIIWEHFSFIPINFHHHAVRRRLASPGGGCGRWRGEGPAGAIGALAKQWRPKRVINEHGLPSGNLT